LRKDGRHHGGDADRHNDHDESRHDGERTRDRTGDQTDLVLELREHNAYLRRIIETRDQELRVRTEELRRKDHIIAALTDRIPELEPAPATRDAPETASEGEVGDHGSSGRPEAGGARRAALVAIQVLLRAVSGRSEDRGWKGSIRN
jgi:hypothetical protein